MKRASNGSVSARLRRRTHKINFECVFPCDEGFPGNIWDVIDIGGATSGAEDKGHRCTV